MKYFDIQLYNYTYNIYICVAIFCTYIYILITFLPDLTKDVYFCSRTTRECVSREQSHLLSVIFSHTAINVYFYFLTVRISTFIHTHPHTPPMMTTLLRYHHLQIGAVAFAMCELNE